MISKDELGFDIEDYRDIYPFESKYMDIDGLKYHYFDEGEGDPILMVHGNPTWSFYYRNLASAFKDSNRVIAVDHIGCGLSSKPQKYDYTLENHISNLVKLIVKLDLKNITLVVHDWGGAIGIGAALRHLDCFKQFVILNTYAYKVPKTKMGAFPFGIAFGRVPVLGKIAIRALNGFARGAAKMCALTGDMSEREKTGMMAPYNSYKNRIATFQFVKDIPTDPSHVSYKTLAAIEEGLPRLKDMPKQVIWGKKDFCFDDTFLSEWKRFFPDIPVYEIPEAGHYVLEDSRQKVIEKVRSFLCTSQPS
ncbi:MAG: alpha/beta fold hydrolase [Candidatus Cloacimonetes bacterium]|nr:alpha/beta fold hydrolase [Candidatus Cloacimonadota bacterium]